MSTHDEIDRDAAERLLRGETVSDHPRVAGLMAAAAAPARDWELAGEDAALAAFAAPAGAGAAPVRAIRKRARLTVKVAAVIAVVAGFGAGGVALAATTGNLPDPLRTDHTTSASRPSPSPSPSQRPMPSRTPSSRAPLPVDLVQLCRQYSAQSPRDRAKSLDSAEFRALVQHAGRKDRNRVDHFCADLRKQSHSSGKTPASPSVRPDANAPGYSGPRRTDLPSGSPDPTRTGK